MTIIQIIHSFPVPKADDWNTTQEPCSYLLNSTCILHRVDHMLTSQASFMVLFTNELHNSQCLRGIVSIDHMLVTIHYEWANNSPLEEFVLCLRSVWLADWLTDWLTEWLTGSCWAHVLCTWIFQLPRFWTPCKQQWRLIYGTISSGMGLTMANLETTIIPAGWLHKGEVTFSCT